MIVALIGKRRGYPDQPMPPHNLPLHAASAPASCGSAGSASTPARRWRANGQAAQALVNTSLAASAAMLGWLVVEKIKDGHATTLGGASGAVAGLVAITPCAGYVGGMSPIYIGAHRRRRLLPRHRHQEGAEARRQPRRRSPCTSSAASSARCCSASSPTRRSTRFGFDGVFFGGGTDLLMDQLVAVGSALVFSAVVTLIIAKVIDLVDRPPGRRRRRGRRAST